ncbi:hypothetical protein B0A55_00108 [Friedmanniomyces simplex]|uniref:G-protein coupled receptors family 2 profile 2 domain-containing protein n=1 Tax=Friedmanniomyces simplex TaxID=329884 RepID=A0A4U0Y6I5_9PEZI|nr:hypothetical protein B0A55_00108 [Friedmanniomyces simplex]
MANETLLRGNCLAPFYDVSAFPSEGGFVAGRFCAPITGLLPGNPTCCLPCPVTDWVYSESFNTYGAVAEWLNVVGLILLSFMLVSYIVLPAQKTRSHYLSICLIVSVMMIAMAFTIPLSAKPEQCYNQITPNDMYSSSECAWSGAFIVAGGLSATMWIFIRALSMNLQICFDIVPGRKFFYLSQALGWGIPAALFTATMTVTGVSFRFGNTCHVNQQTSMQDFWGPLLGFAGAAGIVQVVTFAYCVHVYLKNLWSDQAQSSTHGSSSGLPSYNNSVRTQTARAVYQRLKKVLWLQWRGICIVTIILVDVIFFSIVFVYLDGLQSSLTSDRRQIEPWLECLAFNATEKDKCLGLVTGWLVNEPTVVAVLILLSLTGIQVFLFLARPSIFPAWYDFAQEKFSSKRQEFVSLDARPGNMRSQSGSQLAKYDHVRGHQSTTFEMQKPQLNTLSIDLGSKSPTQTMLSSPSEAYRSPIHHDLDISELDSTRSISPPISGLGRGRFAPEYVGRVTPDPSNPLGSPSPPPMSYNSISLHRQPGDYFDPHQQQQQQQQQQQRRGYTREASIESLPPGYSGRFSPVSSSQHRESHERRYQPPSASFSTPKTPSRQSSTKSVAFAPAELKEGYGRGGLGLNPPSEAGESQEDLTWRGGERGLDRR